MARRDSCPVCGKEVGITERGTVMKHGQLRNPQTRKPFGDPCPGTGVEVQESRETPQARKRRGG